MTKSELRPLCLISGLTFYHMTDQGGSVQTKCLGLLVLYFALPECIGVVQPTSPSLPTSRACPFQACLVNQCPKINWCRDPSCKGVSKNVSRYHRKRHIFLKLALYFLRSKSFSAIAAICELDFEDLPFIRITVSWDTLSVPQGLSASRNVV